MLLKSNCKKSEFSRWHQKIYETGSTDSLTGFAAHHLVMHQRLLSSSRSVVSPSQWNAKKDNKLENYLLIVFSWLLKSQCRSESYCIIHPIALKWLECTLVAFWVHEAVVKLRHTFSDAMAIVFALHWVARFFWTFLFDFWLNFGGQVKG